MARVAGRGVRRFAGGLTCARRATGRVWTQINLDDAYDVGFEHGYSVAEGTRRRSDEYDPEAYGYEPETYYRGFAAGFVRRSRDKRYHRDAG